MKPGITYRTRDGKEVVSFGVDIRSKFILPTVGNKAQHGDRAFDVSEIIHHLPESDADLAEQKITILLDEILEVDEVE